MTEQEWLRCGDPKHMLIYLKTEPRSRKELLFYVACCRRIWHLLEERGQAAVLAAERYADRSITKRQAEAFLEAVLESASAAWLSAASYHAALAAGGPFQRQSAIEAALAVADGTRGSEAYRAERKAQCGIVREIFGNPFCPLPSHASSVLQWNDGLIKNLAEAAYEHPLFPSGYLDPERLGVLSDALEEAGADVELVAHLRGPGPHVRGCAVLDAILAKE